MRVLQIALSQVQNITTLPVSPYVFLQITGEYSEFEHDFAIMVLQGFARFHNVLQVLDP